MKLREIETGGEYCGISSTGHYIGVVEPVVVAMGSVSFGDDKVVFREDQLEWGLNGHERMCAVC